MNDNEKLVLLTETLTAGPAHIIRGALESNEIPCVVADDHPSGLGVGIGIINTRVLVPESYLMQAQRILKELEDNVEN